MERLKIIFIASIVIFTVCETILFTIENLGLTLLLPTNRSLLKKVGFISLIVNFLAFIHLFGWLYGILGFVLGLGAISFLLYYLLSKMHTKDLQKILVEYDANSLPEDIYLQIRMYKVKTGIIIPLFYITFLINVIFLILFLIR